MIYPKLPIVFLSTIASEKADATNSQIASYILAHLDEVRDMGIKDIAHQCHVAVSSISRFCKEIGLRDYAELRELLTGTELYFEESSLDVYTRHVQDCIRQVATSIDLSSIKQLCLSIKEHERVAIFGLLKAGTVALNLQVDLLMLGKQVYTQVAYASQMDYLDQTTQADLIVIFSYTGTYFNDEELRAKKKKLNDPEIWMITGEAREYPAYIDHVILFDSNHDQLSHPYQLQFIAGLIAQEYARLSNCVEDEIK